MYLSINRFIQRITFIHKVHHRDFGYGFVFIPLMIGYFHMYWKVHKLQNARRWHIVNKDHFHDCTVSGVY